MAFLGRTTKGSRLTAIELDKNFLSHYPIGAIYMNANRSDSPNKYIGYGVWNKFAEGRILISADSTENSNPINASPSGSLSHTLLSTESAAHTHSTFTAGRNEKEKGGNRIFLALPGPGNDSSAYYTGYAGGGERHNNVQPYVTVYMWERTAE